MTTARRFVAAALASGLLGLAACGTTDTEDSAGTTPTTEAAATDDCAGVTTEDTGPRTLTDAFGRKVELERPAERVAVLEWQQTEDVLSLCLTPVAVADVAGYGTWNTAEDLPKGVADVGTRGEPNLDALFKSDPDLVIVEATAPDDAAIRQLTKYDVPVLATKGADAEDPIGQMEETFELIARATGREERADEVLEEFRDALEDGKEELAEASLPDRSFVYFDGYITGGNVALRPFGQGSLVGEIGEELGLENVWKGEVDAAYGLGSTDIEGLTAAGDATLFHTSSDEDDAAKVIEAMEGNEVFRSLPAVEEDRVHGFPVGVWTFGGPRSSVQVVEAFVDLLTEK